MLYLVQHFVYSKTCVKWPLSKRQTDYWLMPVKGIAECSLQREHSVSALLSNFIKLPFCIKIFVLSILSGHFTQVLLYLCEDSIEKSIPHDNRLSSLSKPHDAKLRSSGHFSIPSSHSDS